KIELDRLGPQVWRHQSNNFAAVSRLRQQILIGAKHITELHVVTVWKLTRAYDVSLDVSCSLTIGQYWGNANWISILYRKRVHQPSRRVRRASFRQIQS